ASRIAEWNGNTWSNLGEGTSGFVQAILTIDDHLYAAGNFTVAGSSNANRIALWDQITREWFPLGDGLSNNVNDLATDGTFLYAAGQFTIAFNSNSEMYTVNNLVRWDTLGWTPLGTGGQVGTDGVIHTITQDGVDFFIGGSFGVAGGIGTQNAIFWRNPTLPANNEILSIDPTEKINITVFPNPTASHIVLEPQGLFPKDLILYLTSLSGKRWDLTYLGDRYLDLQKIPDGFYVLHLVSDQKKYHKKVKIIKSQVIK
ncbi:MAG: T9SS type A sorting domain-containing protein, partial [Bacteroidota bacterium]